MQFRLRPDLRRAPQKLFVGATWALAIALSAWLAANWYWRLNGTPLQSARPSPVSDPIEAAQDIASRQLFGTPPVAATVSAAAPSNLQVIGVSTRWGKLPGYAVIKDGASAATSFVEGEEISPGVKLVQVLPEAIEVERNGVREQIKLNLGARQNADGPPRTNQPAGASPPAAEN